MMNQQKVAQSMGHLLHQSIATFHNRIITCGLIVAFIYLPLWLWNAVRGALSGTGRSVVLHALIGLGFYFLWRQRSQLAKLTASPEDRLLGYGLIVGGIGLFPFFASTSWVQKLICLLILSGIACSTWGLKFFKQQPIPTFLIALGLFPNSYWFGQTLWHTFTPPELLERTMAWAGAIGLQAIGQPAVVMDTVVTLPGGAVRVAWDCTGFDTAAEVAVASILLGFFLKQPWQKVLLMVLVGIALALLFNIPRIMLLAVAEAYWGKESFEFWHGSWGGQVFSLTTLTVYYYVVMAIVKGRSSKAKA
jgi:exosortase